MSAGLNAARASYQAGDIDAVASWLPRLEPNAEAGDVLAMLGTASRNAGQSVEAVAQWERGLSFLEDGGDLRKASKLGTWIGREHWRQANFAAAMRSLRRAAALADRSEDTQARFSAYSDIADFLWEAGAVAWAEEWHEKAGKLVPLDDAARRSLALRKGILAWSTGRPNLAKAAYQDALAGFTEAGDQHNVRNVHLNLAEVMVELEDFDAASRHIATAKEAREQLSADPGVERPFGDASERYHGGYVALASGDAEKALSLLGEPDPKAPLDWRWQLDTQRGKALLALGRRTQAKAVLQRAVVAIEELRRGAGELRVRDRVARARREPFALLIGIAHDGGQAEAGVAVYERARTQAFMDAVLGRRDQTASTQQFVEWAEQRQRLAQGMESLTPPADPAPTGALAKMPSPVVAWFSAQDRTHALVFDGQRWSSEVVDIGRGELGKIVGEAVSRLSSEAVVSLPASLTKVLMKIPPGVPLAVVADGPLVEIPFSAVQIDGTALGQRNQLRRVISLGVTGDSSEQTYAGNRLALTDPSGDLTGARAEGRRLAAEHGLELANGAHATAARLLEARQAELVHVAAHVGTDDAGVYLQMADKRVYASEVAAWGGAPSTVVLASCASGRGVQSDTWGSLPAAFRAAGARQVLATLWSVDDQDARRVIDLFYASGGSEYPIRALQEAQDELRSEGWPAQRWAAYVVFGEPDAER